MNGYERFAVILIASWVALVGIQQAKIADRTDDINQAIKLLSAATLETKAHCDVAGERTDEMWEEWNEQKTRAN